MAERQPLQSSFAYGEMSPRLLGRSDTERYRQSLRVCENALTYSHGNAGKRPGFLYREACTSTGNVRLFDMQVSPEVALVVEVGFKAGAGYLRVLDRDGYVGAPYEAATPWADDDIPNITVAQARTHTALYFAVGTQAPQRLVVTATGPLAFTFEAVPFTTMGATWAAGNYPRTVTFHQQRLWYGGTPDNPSRLWGSKTGNPLDFALGTGVATDGIDFELTSPGHIRWLRGLKTLLVGTDQGEVLMTAESGVIKPGDIEGVDQSAYGSMLQSAVPLGNGVLYMGADRRRVRFMNYQFLEEGWVSLDLTWPSEHVTEPLLVEMAFKYSPDPFIWCLLADGTLTSAVYEREQNNLVGWHRHILPNGNALALAMTKVGAVTEVWVAVEREIDGNTVRYIERTDRRVDQQPTDYYMDSAIDVVATASGSDIVATGLDHLEGEEVQVQVNGASHVSRTVVGGSITLQAGFGAVDDDVRVGLQYIGWLRTLPLEGLNQGGTAQAMVKRWARIFVRVLRSAIPEINGISSPARFPSDLMDTALPGFSGDLQVADLGRDRDADVDIRMPQALHYDVLALFGDAGGSTL